MSPTLKDTVKYGPWIQSNQKAVQHVHDIASLSLGTVAGILRLESVWGFGVFLVGMTVCNLGVCMGLAHGDPARYFESPMRVVWWGGLSSGLAGYVMMWCLVLALVS